MRFSRSKQRDRVEALQREVAVAEQDRLAAESALTVARSCLAKSEALVAQHSHRCGVLRDLIKSLADQSNRWWQMSVRATVALQALRMTQQDQAYNASANCALKQATLREQDADNRLANIKKSLGALWTRIQSWSAFSSKAERIRSSTADIGQLELGILSAQKKRDQLNAVLQDAITLATDRARPLEAAKQSDLVNRKEVERLAAMTDGIRSSGFSGYLSRASSADRLTLETLQKQAQAEGQARAGRRPPPADDPRRSEKIDRANKERDRRARLKAGHPPLKVEKKEVEDHTNPEHHEKQLYVASMAPFCPKRRFHDERMAKMDPDHQVRYAQFLDWSRQRGWAAAISDALLQDGYFQDRYNNPHAALPLGPGARLIAVRGGHQGFEHLLAARMRSDAQALEFWLGEPVERRVANMGSRSRLKNGAVHLINSWSPELHEPALRGDLDEALARETDLLLARLGLTGHRAATVLHLDSKSGHPHTHIVVSRVSDDGALWSLQGRERAVALWLHGRSNTVTLFGPDALHDDIDALAGPSEAAKAGETLMYHGKLAADRHHLDGRCERVVIQGKEAASRMWHVGRTGADLAGGIWLFGLGADPKAKESWETMMEKVRAKGDKAQEIEVAKLKPAQRGYWLPMHDAKDAPERSTKPGYGHYLARQSKGAKAR